MDPRWVDEIIQYNSAQAAVDMQPPPQTFTVQVNRDAFVTTRNALTNAYLGLSSALDRAIKAYIDHTETILAGQSSLDISQLLQPIQGAANAAQAVQLALQNGHLAITPGLDENGHIIPTADGKRKKRAYKQRDPNAPKRPLTAYFRYLREVRPIIAKEVADSPPSEGTKAGDISKIATERWKALGDAKRKPYHDAYKSELAAYDDAVKAYKATGANVEDEEEGEDEELDSPARDARPVTLANDEDDSSDDSDDSSSSDDSSDSDEEEPVKPVPPPKPVKSASPELTKKTPKASTKKAKAPTPAANHVNPNIDPQLTAPPPAPMLATPSSPAKKRKSTAEDAGSSKKRGKISKKDQAAADAAAASSQLVPEVSQSDAAPSTEKNKKKKRKSEAAAA